MYLPHVFEVLHCPHSELVQVCMYLPHVFEVLHCPHSELEGGVLVNNNHGVWVLLKSRHSPHVAHTLLNCLVESESLVCASDENKNLLGVHPVPTPTVNACLGTRST